MDEDKRVVQSVSIPTHIPGNYFANPKKEYEAVSHSRTNLFSNVNKKLLKMSCRAPGVNYF